MGDAVGTTANDACRNGVYIPGFSFGYDDLNVPAIKAFRDAFARYQPGKPLHQWALEAWAQGQMVAQGVAKMGAAPTRKGLEDYLRSLNKYTDNGILVGLDWQPRNYAAPTGAYCTTIAHWQDSAKGWVDETGTTAFCVNDAKQYYATALEQGN